jgi:hypothetical protein
MTISIHPRVSEFTLPQIPVEEISAFYTLNGSITPSEQRPYAWSNSLTSIDGFLHLKDPQTEISHLGLAHVEGIGHNYPADFRLLNGGWMMSDAVMVSAEVISIFIIVFEK